MIWSEKRVTFGQNDYIDILGSGNVHPTDLIRGPKWLIGFKGNELQRLARQKKSEGRSINAVDTQKYLDMQKRIKFLYRKFNIKFGGKKK